MEVRVDYEWGALEEAVVGIGQGIVMPDTTAGFEYLTRENLDQIMAFQGKPLAEFDPEQQDTVVQQVEALAAKLAELGVRVHRPRPLTPGEADFLGYIQRGRLQIFTRDPMLVVGDKVIETSLMTPLRRKERFGIRPVLDERLAGTGAGWVSMPEPPPQRDGGGPGPFLEGGDVLLMGETILVGMTGHASNMAGVEWLRRYLGPEYAVIPVPLRKEFLHLDCALSLCRPGLAVICPEAFTDGIPACLDGWDFVRVTPDQAARLACNGLVLDRKRYICGAEHEEVAEGLAKLGQEVLTLPFDQVSRSGGGFRCAHHPLRRIGS